MKHYPENNPGHFITQLPQNVDLSGKGEYEVGLAEIQFNNSFFNVQDKEVWLLYEPDPTSSESEEEEEEEEEEAETAGYHHHNRARVFSPVNYVQPMGAIPTRRRRQATGRKKYMDVPGGLYDSNEYLIRTLNQLILKVYGRRVRDILSFSYNKANRTATIHLSAGDAKVTMSHKLQTLLSLPTSVLRGPTVISGVNPINLNKGFNNIFIYSDIVAARSVGDVSAPLLRIVQKNLGREETFFIFEKPHYLPLSRNEFRTVEILLTSDKGTPVSFYHGITVVTLHFRRCRGEDL